MPFKDPVKKQEYHKQYRINNRLQINLNNKVYTNNNKEKIKQRYNESQNIKIYNWKRQGIKSNNFENLFLKWKNTYNCELCNSLLEGKGTYKKCVDHHHDLGYVRNIVCAKCNCKRPIVERLQVKLLLELHRYFLRN